jgi:hypothetical protein
MSLDDVYRVKVEGVVNREVFKVAAKALQAVVSATPVGNPELWESKAPAGYTGGHARRNWQVDVDNFAPSEIEGVDKSGATTITEGTLKAKTFDIARNTKVVLHNSAPYIRRLDEGHSAQAPAGFVSRAVQAAAR